MNYATKLFLAILLIAQLSSCEESTREQKLLDAGVSSECTRGVKLSCLGDITHGESGIGPLKHCTVQDRIELLKECRQLISEL